jgi:hypothetical protein
MEASGAILEDGAAEQADFVATLHLHGDLF